MKSPLFFSFVFILGIALCLGQEAGGGEADALFSAGKWKEALALYEKALPEAQPGEERHRLLIRIGLCQQRTRLDAAAVETFRLARVEPGIGAAAVAESHLQAGYSLRMQQKEHEAIAELKPATESADVSADVRAEALLYTGWAYGQLEDFDAAIEAFGRVETVPEVHGNYAATANLSIGRYEQNRKRYDEAIAAFRKVSTFAPVTEVNLSRARNYLLECEALKQGDVPFSIKPFVTLSGGAGPLLQWVSQGVAPARMQASLRRSDSGADVPLPAVQTLPLANLEAQLHRIALPDLEPGQVYRYEIQAGEESAGGTFRAPAAPGSPVIFRVIGDTQSYAESLQPLLDAMGAAPADLTIHVGDLVDLGTVWGEWKFGFFDPGAPYLGNSAISPVYGNHDGGPYYPAFFGGPAGSYYSYDWGDAHFVMLDSYGAGSGGVGRKKQLEWLERDLAANKRRWTIVALHVPMISTPVGLKDFGQEDFLPIMEKHGVDIVFSGHHPHYRRYLPIGAAGAKPILHITSGGGGGPIGGAMPSPLQVVGKNPNHFCLVHIEGDTLHLTANSIDGSVLDDFRLTKEGDQFAEPWKSEAVDRVQVESVISLYQELTTDRVHQLKLAQRDGDLVLDLARLPRGSLDAGKLPDDARLSIESTDSSPWKVVSQTFDLRKGPFVIQATAPEKNQTAKGRVTPGAELRLRLSVGDRDYLPFTAEAEIIAGP